MTAPHDELLTLATPYALHAVSDHERAAIDAQLHGSPAGVADAFNAEVRGVRETVAAMSVTTALEPPAYLRDRVLAAIAEGTVRELRPRRRWNTAVLAAAAAVVIGLSAFGIGWWLRPPAPTTTAEQVFAAPDVRTVSGAIPTGGTATVVFSRERNAGVLVMNNVAPPPPGSVYQMWLIDHAGPHSAGVMNDKAIGPSTTAVLPDLGSSTTLAFTLEQGTGSTQPTSAPFAQLTLS